MSTALLGHMQENRAWLADIIDTIHQQKWRPEHGGDLGYFSAKVTRVTAEQREALVKRRIINSLRFAEIADRYESILEAHKKTFEWIFKQPSRKSLHKSSKYPFNDGDRDIDELKWVNFAEWLRCPESLYWITGKPGSGKSTLMKFLYNDQRTKRYLENWSGNRSLIMSGFFFWNSGTTIQMSRMGLLRTLLFDILQDRPSLVPEAFPKRWDAYDLFGEDPSPMTWSELTKALEIVVSNSSAHYAFFIDGLDEFDGDTTEMSEFILRLSTFKGVKICAASRPWPVFEDTFSQRPRLRVETLTNSDIRLFVSEKLNSHIRFREMSKLMTESSRELIFEITDKAQGVFLWVRIVVQSLLEGFRDGDSLESLHQRLHGLPSDLEELFKKILDHLNPKYFKEASELFQLVAATASESISLFTLFLAQEGLQKALEAPRKPFSQQQVSFDADTMKRRMASRCQGLIEAPEFDNQGGNSKVQYLHRTVRDFLDRKDIWDFVKSGTPDSYNPPAALCGAYVWLLKAISLEQGFSEKLMLNIWTSLLPSIHYYRLADNQDRSFNINIVDCMFGTVDDIWWQRDPVSQDHCTFFESALRWAGLEFENSPRWDLTAEWIRNSVEPLPGSSFLFSENQGQSVGVNFRGPSTFERAFRLQLYSYVAAKIDEGTSVWTEFGGRSLMRIASMEGNERMVELLLRKAAECNELDERFDVERHAWFEGLQNGNGDIASRDQITAHFLDYGLERTLQTAAGSENQKEKHRVKGKLKIKQQEAEGQEVKRQEIDEQEVKKQEAEEQEVKKQEVEKEVRKQETGALEAREETRKGSSWPKLCAMCCWF